MLRFILEDGDEHAGMICVDCNNHAGSVFCATLCITLTQSIHLRANLFTLPGPGVRPDRLALEADDLHLHYAQVSSPNSDPSPRAIR